jgi:hypothetical protein
LLTLGKCKDKGYLPVLSVWISNDGHYAFVEFRSVIDTEECRDIGHLKLMGRDLRVGKTKLASGGMCGQQPSAEGETYNRRPANKISDTVVKSPTTTLLIEDVLDLSLVTCEEDFDNVEIDFRRECKRYGEVLKVFAPRPKRFLKGIDLLKEFKL